MDKPEEKKAIIAALAEIVSGLQRITENVKTVYQNVYDTDEVPFGISNAQRSLGSMIEDLTSGPIPKKRGG